MAVSMTTVHWGTFDVRYFQDQISSRTFHSTVRGICSEAAKTQHSSAFHNFWVCVFTGFSFQNLLTPRDAKGVLNLRLLRRFHAFCQWLDLRAEPAKIRSSWPVASCKICHDHLRPSSCWHAGANGWTEYLHHSLKSEPFHSSLDRVVRHVVSSSTYQCSWKDTAARSAYCSGSTWEPLRKFKTSTCLHWKASHVLSWNQQCCLWVGVGVHRTQMC